MTSSPADDSPFVSAVAARIQLELHRLADGGFVIVTAPPMLTCRERILLGFKRTQERPGTTQAYRYEDHLIVTTSGDRRFGGPLDLGPVHDAIEAVGYGVERKDLNPRREYRAEILLAEAGRAARLMAQTHELLGANDVAAVTIDTEADG